VAALPCPAAASEPTGATQQPVTAAATTPEDTPSPLASEATPVAAVDDTLPPLPPAKRLVLNSLNIFRWNPIGLESQNRFGWQQRIYEGKGRATRDNFWFAGTYLRLNPASVRAAAMIEVQPLAVFNLRLTAEQLYYYGNFTFLQSRGSATDDLSDAAMKQNREGPLGNYAGGGQHVSIEPTLQVAFGPKERQIVIRNKTLLGWFNMDLRSGDRVWYEPTLDVPVPRQGWVLANDADLLWRGTVGKATLTLGLRYSMVRPLYDSGEVKAGEEPDAAAALKDHHRLGLLAAYTFYDTVDARFEKPTVLLIASRYLDHAHRLGVGPNSVNANVPYLVLGFAFQSDLLGR
jgi:hypothetical protein